MRVTVVIPAYRAARTIGRAIESVLRQTRPASEILVIDDGSPDDVAAAVAPYNGRVTLLRKPNGGAASARNLGIDRSTGDLVAFLDADDYWEPHKLERHVVLYEQHAELGLTCSRHFEEPPGAERRECRRSSAVAYDAVVSLNGPEAFRFATKVWTGTVVVRRSVLGGERFVSGLEPAEDRHLWVRMVTAAPACCLSEPLATAVLEEGSLSRSSVDRDCRNMLRVVRDYRSLLGWHATRRWEGHTYYRWAACDADPRSALARLVLSWVYWPIPFRRADVRMPFARPKLLGVTLGRLLRRAGGTAAPSSTRAVPAGHERLNG